MLHLFIDTSVLIRFYSFTDDSLLEAEKFIALVTSKKIALYVTQQIMNEYIRNSESEVAKSLQDLDNTKFSVSFPRFIEHYEEATLLKKIAKECHAAKIELIKKVRLDAANGNLRADKLVQQLLVSGTLLLSDEKVVESARLRRDIGNPPGKPSSLGDQINWEHLIKSVPKGNDLHIISRDDDFASKLDQSLAGRFLVDEWKSEKNGDLFVYPSLGHFAKKHFPDIKVPSDIIKSEAIEKLIKSGSFAATHAAIAKLQTVYSEITLPEALVLLQAALDNPQIGWIIEDEDVRDFYEKLQKKYWDKLSSKMDNELFALANYFEVPF